MSEYEDLLRSMMPDFFWFRDGHVISNNRVKILGTVLLGEGRTLADIETFIDGIPAEMAEPSKSKYAEDKFWFVRESQKFAIEFSADIPEGKSCVTATACVKGLDFSRLNEFSFKQYARWQDLEPTPPVENIERVSGKGATAYNYHNNGASDFMRFCNVAERNGVDISSSTKVLDWGCGCGRLTRHFQSEGVGVYGIDIDRHNISWCQQHLDASAFSVTSLYPPTTFDTNTFDLVIANSVLSHLNLEAMEAWLTEVHRILRPGGLALLSYHGQFSLCGFSSRTESFVRNVLQTGFNSNLKANEVNDVIADPEYYRHTFMTDEHASSLFEKNFDLEEIVVGVVSRFQNMAVLRKRKVPAE